MSFKSILGIWCRLKGHSMGYIAGDRGVTIEDADDNECVLSQCTVCLMFGLTPKTGEHAGTLFRLSQRRARQLLACAMRLKADAHAFVKSPTEPAE